MALIKNREKYIRLEDDEHMYYLFAYDLSSTFDVNMLLFAFYVPFVVVVYMARIINFSAKYKHRKSLCFTAPSAQEIFAHAPRRRCRRIVCDKSGERLVQNLRSSPQIGCCRRYINVCVYIIIIYSPQITDVRLIVSHCAAFWNSQICVELVKLFGARLPKCVRFKVRRNL